MNVYSKFNDKNLNTNFHFLNGLVVGNENNRVYERQSGSGIDIDIEGVVKNKESSVITPIKNEIYDELFKQATIHTGKGGVSTKKKTKFKRGQLNSNTNTNSNSNSNTKKNKKKV